MAVTTYSKRCNCCGGNKWDYKKDLKIWICKYCGAQVERQEQYDGLYTIKNVVRQVILDAAYRRMEQADRNLSECQKINARYAGTLVAGICYRLIAAVSGTTGQDPRALLGQLRRDYQALNEESSDMGDDETAVYEFLDSSDAWAALATVFDTLGDTKRRDYLLTLTDVSQVFSKETNKSLLRYALKNSKLDYAQQILANKDNVDVQDAFQTVLGTCPDGVQKGTMAAGMIAAGALKPGEEETLENYLSGNDAVQTKAQLVMAALQAGLTLHMEILLREVLGLVDLPTLQQLLVALFTRRLYDGEVELLMGFAAAQKGAEASLAVLDAMVASGQFIALNQRQAQAFMTGSQFTPEDRVQILQRLKSFSAPDKMWEAVAGEYLCSGRETVENRTAMLNAVFAGLNSIPAKDFERYVLTCPADGEAKPDRIRGILSLPGMNTGFFRELAGKYLKGSADSADVRGMVLRQLMDCGLTIDGTVLIDYICNSADSADSKVELVQTAVRNGTVLRADALSIYLERCANFFAPEVFALLYKDGSSVSQKAIENYVLSCADAPAVKAQNARTLASRMGIPLGSTTCMIRFNGNNIKCQLAQAYLLTTKEPANQASAMMQTMISAGTRLNTDIQVGGSTKKFSKFVTDVRSQLSPVAEQLCQENRLFSRLFGF